MATKLSLIESPTKDLSSADSKIKIGWDLGDPLALTILWISKTNLPPVEPRMKPRIQHLRRALFFLSMWIWAEHLTRQSSVQFMGIPQAKASFQQSVDDIESAESPAAKKFRELAEPAAKAKAKAAAKKQAAPK